MLVDHPVSAEATHSICLGTVTILVKDEQFADGYQNGYLTFRLSRPYTRMTEQEVYSFLLTNITDVHHSDRWNAGYLVGWITGFLERWPESVLDVVLSPRHTLMPCIDRSEVRG